MSSTGYASRGLEKSDLVRKVFTTASILIMILVLFLPAKALAAPVPWYRVDPKSGFGNPANIGTRCMAEYGGCLYTATYSSSPEALCEVWRYNGTNWSKVADKGFGRPNNYGARCMATYNGNLYVGTDNRVEGGEIWEYDGTTWECIADHGFGENQRIDTMTVLNDRLFVGTAGNYIHGCQVWEYDGTSWQKVADKGFGDKNNAGAVCSASYKGLLTVGVDNEVTGAEAWVYDGARWKKIADKGLGNKNNNCFWAMAVYKGSLFATTQNNSAGCEVWAYDGHSWHRVMTGGFGTTANATALGICVYRGLLYVGTEQWGFGLGTQVFAYNGSTWNQVNTNGFGSLANLGSWSMCVYDDYLFVGTSNILSGTEIWTTKVTKNSPPVVTSKKPAGYEKWYLAEGSTGSDAKGGFETWVLLENAGIKKAKAQITYLTPEGTVPGPTATLEPGTRQTFNVADTIKNNWSISTQVTSDQPIIAERSMYWNSANGTYREAATDSIGVTHPGKSWFLAEGSTGADPAKGSFETWVLLENAGSKKAKAQITYLTPEGTVPGPTTTLAPNTRQTFNVADTVKNNWSVSTQVTSDEPIIAERAVYWNSADGTYRQAATDSIGVAHASGFWFLPEGSTGSDPAKGGFETWVLLVNAGDQKAKAQITYLTPQGTVPGPTATLKPGTRQTFNVADTLKNNWSVSTQVTSDQPIVAERSMYWNSADGTYRQAAHDSIGVTHPGQSWFLAEGSTGADPAKGSFETWVLLVNAGSKKATVKITYLTPEGTVPGPTAMIEPGTRQTFNVADTVKNNWSVSTQVTSDEPISAERAMYWNSADGTYRQAAHDSIGFDP